MLTAALLARKFRMPSIRELHPLHTPYDLHASSTSAKLAAWRQVLHT